MSNPFKAIPILYDTKESLAFDKEINSINELTNKESWNDEDLLESLKLSKVRICAFYNIDNITYYNASELFDDYCSFRSGGSYFIANMSLSQLINEINNRFRDIQ